MSVSLPVALLLLALDDEKGKPLIDSTLLDSGLASASLLELISTGSLVVSDEQLHRVEAPADDLFEEISRAADDQSLGDAVMKIAGVSAWTNASQDLRTALLERMVESGELGEHRSRILGLISRTTYPQANGNAETDLRRDLDQVLLQGEPCDTRLAQLIGVAQACGLVAKLYDDPAAVERAKRIAAGDPNAAAVTESYDTLMGAIIATIGTATGAQ